MSATHRDPLHTVALVFVAVTLVWIGLRLPDGTTPPVSTPEPEALVRALERVVERLGDFAARPAPLAAGPTNRPDASTAEAAAPEVRRMLPDDAGLVRELAALRATLATLRGSLSRAPAVPAVISSPAERTAEVVRRAAGVRNEDDAIKARAKQDLLLRTCTEIVQTLGKPQQINVGSNGRYESWSYQVTGLDGQKHRLDLIVRDGRVISAH